MTSVKEIIEPRALMSPYEQERAAAVLAAIAKAQHDARGIIESLERSMGVTQAYPATRYALALLDAVDSMAKRAGGAA